MMNTNAVILNLVIVPGERKEGVIHEYKQQTRSLPVFALP